MVGIIDYGVGNIRAFSNAYTMMNIEHMFISSPEQINEADKLILPGVGSFDHAMRSLSKSGLRQTLDEAVLDRKCPVLGICVGMQMLASDSEEGTLKGLGWIKGKVVKFDKSKFSSDLPLPHMGWNNVKIIHDNPLLSNISSDSMFYFLHSYHIECSNADDVIAVAEYGYEFAAVINRDNIFGIQQHPEKSHRDGMTILRNFGEL